MTEPPEPPSPISGSQQQQQDPSPPSDLSTPNLHNLTSIITSPDTPLPLKINTIQSLRTLFTDCPTSPHFILPPNSNGIFLPSLDWTLFRKGYTLLFWLRIKEKKEGKGYIHKFHSKPNHGVQTTWKNDVFTGVTLPRQHKPDRGGTFFQDKLVLRENEWMLFCVKHSFPYLKKPTLSVNLNGSTVISSELSYPAPEGWMSHGTILSHFPFQIDVGCVGLFADVLPDDTLALIAEYGPRSATGIIPVIPPVPSHREGMYTHAMTSGKKKKIRPTNGLGTPSCIQTRESLSVQKWSGKLMFGISPRDAKIVRGGRVVVCANSVPKLGDTAHSPKLGVMNPNGGAGGGGGAPGGAGGNGSGKSGDAKVRGNAQIFGSVAGEGDVAAVWYALNGSGCCLLAWRRGVRLNGWLKTANLAEELDSPSAREDLKKNNVELGRLLLHLLADGLRLGGLLREAAVQEWTVGGIASLLMRVLDTKEEVRAVVDGCLDVVDACCGRLQDRTRAAFLRRTGDLALGAVMSLSLSFELWSRDVESFTRILVDLNSRYSPGNTFLRNHMTPQHLLDNIRLYFPKCSRDDISLLSPPLSALLNNLLLASITSDAISQGERDISHTLVPLMECPLGSLVTNVILSSLHVVRHSEEMRLGRGLLMAEYHTVIGPMLLSRTISQKQTTSGGALPEDADWREDWRKGLELFIWLTSISGTEGIAASQALAPLLKSSAIAGNLTGGLNDNCLRSCFTVRESRSLLLPLLPALCTPLLDNPSESDGDTLLLLLNLLPLPSGAQHPTVDHLRIALEILITLPPSDPEWEMVEDKLQRARTLLEDLINYILITATSRGMKKSTDAWKVMLEELGQKPEVLTSFATHALEHFNASEENELMTNGSQTGWTTSICEGLSRIMVLLEEKVVTSASYEVKDGDTRLVTALLTSLKIGREVMGWCQLPSPTTSSKPFDPYQQQGVLTPPPVPPPAISPSKNLLPILQPALRIVVSLMSHHPECHSELRRTIQAALVGLTFPNARDWGLYALTNIRAAMLKDSVDDAPSTALPALFAHVTKELQLRHADEKRAKTTASKNHDGDAATVEKLMIGEGVPPDPDDDFILYGGGQGSHEDGEEEGDATNVALLGWANYAGLSQALEKCAATWEGVDTDDGAENVVDVSSALEILRPYLDVWDENSRRDKNAFLEISVFDDISTNNAQTTAAADTMTHFIELANVERTRWKDVVQFFTERSERVNAFVDASCWKVWWDHANVEDECVWERGMLDAGRDVYSRLITGPMEPQFPRFIPEYLDHSKQEIDENSKEVVAKEEEELEDDVVQVTMEESLTKAVRTGKLSVVDITKVMLPNPDEFDDDDDDEGSLGFPSIGSDNSDDLIMKKKKAADDNAAAATGGIVANASTDMDDTHMFDEETTQQTATTAETGTTTANNSATTEQKKQQEQFHSSNPSLLADEPENTSSSSLTNNIPHHHYTLSSFSHPPDGSILGHGGPGSGAVEIHWDNCLHVRPEGSRKGVLLITNNHIVMEYEASLYEGELLAMQEIKNRQRGNDEAAAALAAKNKKCNSIPEEPTTTTKPTVTDPSIAALSRPRAMRWSIAELSHIYLRRYRLRDSALELFFIPSGGSLTSSISCFFDFGAGATGNIRRDEAAGAIMKRAPSQCIKQWPENSHKFMHEHLNNLTLRWCEGSLSNFEYLLQLNFLAGRSFNDLCQYPVMPWVLSDYTSEDIPDLENVDCFRDMSKPMGALNPERLDDFLERFETFSDPTIPPFMYGSHYSTSAGVVLHFLLRLHPFATLHRQLQNGHFDVADRLFSSVPRTWDMCTGSSAAEVKELTPEWYCNPMFLRNVNKFKLGTSQEGEVLGDVMLPPWAKGSPEVFVEVMRCALESDVCSQMLPSWIDLIFGYKQQGPEAIKAHNVFFYLTYYGSVDVASIDDPALRTATELQIAHFGQCPMQLFWRPHVQKLPRSSLRYRLGISRMLNLYTLPTSSNNNKPSSDDNNNNDDDDEQQQQCQQPQPFMKAPLSHWVHLAAPPPGPHAPLIAVRLALTDRCLAIDSQGIFHLFRWAWKPDEHHMEDKLEATSKTFESSEQDFYECKDKGCFVAQRELHHFRAIPRLPFVPSGITANTSGNSRPENNVTVAISVSLFASHSLLLVLSDGDGKGALAMQFVDPSKGIVKGEVILPAVHSNRITAIAMDPIGTAAGHGGVGGDLAILGSADGTSTLWRFVSSHFLPMRPRLRMRGHGGRRIRAVAVNSALNVCATVSERRCCLFHLGNGTMLRSFAPPEGRLFADTSAVCLSMQGFIVLVTTTEKPEEETDDANFDLENASLTSEEEVPPTITIELYSLEGVHIGSHIHSDPKITPSKSFTTRIPHKIASLAAGRAIMVCSQSVVTLHKLSPLAPLALIDTWRISCDDDSGASAYDVDLGPFLTRPVVAAAACSAGALRLHALPGIGKWSEENRKGVAMSGAAMAVGNALGRNIGRVKNVVGGVKDIGRGLVGLGRDLGLSGDHGGKEGKAKDGKAGSGVSSENRKDTRGSSGIFGSWGKSTEKASDS